MPTTTTRAGALPQHLGEPDDAVEADGVRALARPVDGVAEFNEPDRSGHGVGAGRVDEDGEVRRLPPAEEVEGLADRADVDRSGGGGNDLGDGGPGTVVAAEGVADPGDDDHARS